MKTPKRKFKVLEKDVEIKSKFGSDKIGDVQWEGEELGAESTTKITEDKGTGREVVLRFFDFGANPEVFKQHKPTAQELFDGHRKGLESLLWRDGLKPFEDVQPRLMFSKDKSPLDKKCDCFVCQNYKRNYLSHLFRAKEIAASSLLTFHNLYFFNTFIEKIRERIKAGKF